MDSEGGAMATPQLLDFIRIVLGEVRRKPDEPPPRKEIPNPTRPLITIANESEMRFLRLHAKLLSTNTADKSRSMVKTLTLLYASLPTSVLVFVSVFGGLLSIIVGLPCVYAVFKLAGNPIGQAKIVMLVIVVFVLFLLDTFALGG